MQQEGHVQVKDIAWLAGFLEGEGSFTAHAKRFPRITFKLVDLDVAERAAMLLGGNVRGPYRGKYFKEHYQSIYSVSVNGSAAIGWMLTIYSLMGARRKKRIYNLLKYWKLFGGGPRGKTAGFSFKLNPDFIEYERSWTIK